MIHGRNIDTSTLSIEGKKAKKLDIRLCSNCISYIKSTGWCKKLKACIKEPECPFCSFFKRSERILK